MMAIKALEGAYLTFEHDPFGASAEHAMTYEPHGIIVIENGKITDLGPADSMRDKLPANVEITRYGKDQLIMPGFVDAHVHYPQLPIIGAYGQQLIEWLNKYTFPAEQSFEDEAYAAHVADVFLTECLRAGTTTGAVYCTVHPQSVNAFFGEAEKRNMRMIAGKVLMDRNAPDGLRDTAQRGYDESKALIDRWHGRGRALYGITPRFAPTSTPDQLEAAGQLWAENPGTYVQSHISENLKEIEWVADLFPDHKGYLDVYDRFGLLGDRAIYGHGVHLREDELLRMHETGAAIAHCPTSNFFLGSGAFDVTKAKDVARPVRIGMGTDVGAGTSISMLQTLNEAYKAAQLNGQSLSAQQAFYLATAGTADALCLGDKVGRLKPGMEADMVVLDMRSTPLIDFRMNTVETIDEALFVQMTMGDDRATQATYVAGECLYSKN